MADKTKKVNRGIPSGLRNVLWDESDSDESDVLLVKDSLGRAAGHMEVRTDANSSLRLKFNVYHTVYPRRPMGMGFDADNFGYGENWLVSGHRYKDDTQNFQFVDASQTFTLDDDTAINDVELFTASGTYRLMFT